MSGPVWFWAWVRGGRVHLISTVNPRDIRTGCNHPVDRYHLQRLHDRDAAYKDLCHECVKAARSIGLPVPGAPNSHGREGFQY